jgi:deoxyxylulose-5-phosphate synthase
MTEAQKRKIAKLAARIADLTNKAYDVIGDDEMVGGEAWVALNNINSAVQDIQLATEAR